MTITLDNSTQSAQPARVGVDLVEIRMSPPAVELTGNGSQLARLVTGLELRDGNIYLQLSSPAFGYISTRPARDSLVLDVYSDPLGARWRSDGNVASASVAPPPAAVLAEGANLPSDQGLVEPTGAANPLASSISNPTVSDSAEQNGLLPTGQIAETGPVTGGTLAQFTPEISGFENSQAATDNPGISASLPGTAAVSGAPAASSSSNSSSRPLIDYLESGAESAATVPAVVQQANTEDSSRGEPVAPMPAENSSIRQMVTANQELDGGQLSVAPDSSNRGDPVVAPNFPVAVAQTSAEFSPGQPHQVEDLGRSQPASNDGAALPQGRLPGVTGSPPVQVFSSAPPSIVNPTQPLLNIQINEGGPEDWPESAAISFSPQAARSGSAFSTVQAGTTGVPVSGVGRQDGLGGIVPDSGPQSSTPTSRTVAPEFPPLETMTFTPIPLGPDASDGNDPASLGFPPLETMDFTPIPLGPGVSDVSDVLVGSGSPPPPAVSSQGNGTLASISLPSEVLSGQDHAGQSSVSVVEPVINNVPVENISVVSQNNSATVPVSSSETPAAVTPVEPPVEPSVEEAVSDLEPIYVDEAGNPVPPPLDKAAILSEIARDMRAGKYEAAIENIEILRPLSLDRNVREQLLYDFLLARYEKDRDSLDINGEEIIQAAYEAMNFNLDSARVPEAMSILALTNLELDNIDEARGYINLMRQSYPTNSRVPNAFLKLGEKYMERGEYTNATDAFITIVQQYPESQAVRDASRLETHALYKQGHYGRALTLVDFVERRWPEVYLSDPLYLSIAADVRMKEGRVADALSTYWMEYNLQPDGPNAATVLQRIGEIYFLLDDAPIATRTLEMLVRDFPQSQEIPIALMRIGENGVHEGNLSLDDLLKLFSQNNPRLPSIYYQRILQEHPNSPQAILAALRTIAWQFWSKEYYNAMNAARSFMIDYAGKPEAELARDILLRSFAWELGFAMNEQNYDRVLSLWERFPQVQEYYQPLEDELRFALARAYLQRGIDEEGMAMLAPFLDGGGHSDYGMYTYNNYLSAYLRQQDWSNILSLGDKVQDWDFPSKERAQLDYSMALAAENLGLPGRALALWNKLAPRTDIPLYQRAYANYFLARDAERRQDLGAAYQYNLDTLGMFTDLGEERSPFADSERIRETIAALMDVTEIANRYAESLEWANKYAAFVPLNSPDYAGLRFREARLHRKMGDMSRWRAILQGIIDSEPDSVFGKMASSELRTSDVARDLTRFTGQ